MCRPRSQPNSRNLQHAIGSQWQWLLQAQWLLLLLLLLCMVSKSCGRPSQAHTVVSMGWRFQQVLCPLPEAADQE